jgi:predicted ribosome quality control (RQC) complex YloA/Tae2 family protein
MLSASAVPKLSSSSGEQRSLNFREINLLLADTQVTGARLQDFYQPQPEELIIDLFLQGRRRPLLFCMSQKACRFHFLSRLPPKSQVRQRFVSFLYAHGENSVILGIEHVSEERILKITLARGGIISILWVRLWSSAPNIIFTDEAGLIGDALFRRPKKGEVSGGHFDPQAGFLASPPRTPDPDKYPVRDFGGDPASDLHERVEIYFQSLSATNSVGLRESLLTRLAAEEHRLSQSLRALEGWLADNADDERQKQIGDIIMSSLAAIPAGAEWFTGADFYHDDAPIDIRLDITLTPAQNAEKYYRLHKKTKATRKNAEEERAVLLKKIETLKLRAAEISATDDPGRLEEFAEKSRAPKSVTKGKEIPGLTFVSQGFVLLVGRTAKENDALYRHHARGNDYWMHVRDHSGASVFIKSRKAKSIPLEVLLDAGNLAVFYSKAKTSGRANLFYTQVKYLKKTGSGQAGLFIPTQEKNIAIRLETDRITRLKRDAETYV